MLEDEDGVGDVAELEVDVVVSNCNVIGVHPKSNINKFELSLWINSWNLNWI